MTQHWIAVASADHVRRARTGGFMQVNHGKLAPLKKIEPGDRIACYSPTEIYGSKDRLQAFTAIGTVGDGEPYSVDMGNGFVPYRRKVQWEDAQDASICGLLDRLGFSAGRSNWGYQLRFGLLKVSAADFEMIELAMKPGRPRQ